MQKGSKRTLCGCCKKKKEEKLTQDQRDELAIQRWRKIWLLRDLLVTVDE